MKNLRKSFLALLTLAFLAACGQKPSSYDEGFEDTSSEPTEVAVEDAMEESRDIVALASDTEFLSTLVSAIAAGQLVETLQGDGPFTVFAPTNDAFVALPAGTLEDLLKPENKDQLVAILTYHVVPGIVMSTDLSDGMSAVTVNGAEITITATGGAKVNGANITAADIQATNGVVHVIDQVILPPSQ